MNIRAFALRMFVFGAFVFFSTPASRLAAQSASGALRVLVTDPSGAAVGRARITVEGPAEGEKTSVMRNRDGIYEIDSLKAGNYKVTADAPDFAPRTETDVTIAVGRIRQLTIQLQIAQQIQQMNVSSNPSGGDVAPDNNMNKLVIKGQDLDALSDDPDELASEIQALAGPAAGPDGGQIYIDGFTGGQLPPKSAIREIRVNQNPFSAEYDKIGYGRIEILTKPGSDKFHGRFMVNGNDSSFNSQNPFASAEPGYHSQFMAGSLSGPISKKASFSFDGMRRDIQDVSVVSAFTLDSALSQSAFNESVLNPKLFTNLGARIDYQLTGNNTLTGRYQYVQKNDTNDGVGQLALSTQAYNVRNIEQTVQLTDTQILGAGTLNETRFQYLRERDRQTPQNTAATVNVLGAFTAGGSNQGSVRDDEGHFDLQNETSIAKGKHLIKFGGRLREVLESNDSTAGFNGAFSFTSLNAYQITEEGLAQGSTAAQIRAAGGGASQFILTTGNPLARISLTDAGVYGQDDWRIRTNMLLSFGLRYEIQNHISDRTDVAPRLGFAWGIGKGKSPKMVVRAGFGIFYSRLQQEQILKATRLNGIEQQEYVVASPDFFPYSPSATELSGSLRSPTTYRIDPDLRAPRTVQSAISLERSLSKVGTLSVTYVNSRGTRQLLSRNNNAPLSGTFDPSDPSSGTRPYGNVGNIYEYESQGIFNQNQFMANFTVRAGSKLSLFGFYALGYAKSDTSGVSSFPMNQYDVQEDYGRAIFDVRNRLFIGGSWSLPFGIRASPFLIANSGQPFNITVGQDLNGDSIFNDRPAFATDLSRSSIVVTRLGTFDTNPLPGQKIIPTNYGSGPGQFALNLRLSKTFSFGKLGASPGFSGGGFGPPGGGNGAPPGGQGAPGAGLGPGGLSGGAARPPGLDEAGSKRYSVTLSASAQNILNHVSLGTPIGNLTSPLFAQSVSLAQGPFSNGSANRRIDLQLMFSF